MKAYYLAFGLLLSAICLLQAKDILTTITRDETNPVDRNEQVSVPVQRKSKLEEEDEFEDEDDGIPMDEEEDQSEGEMDERTIDDDE